MKITPKSEEEIALENLIAEGNYPFTVSQSADLTSKQGNEMIGLVLHIHRPDGGIRKVDDFLLDKMAFKLRHFCIETNLLDVYQQGKLSASDCEGKSGYVFIGVEPAKDSFPAKNKVKDYGRPKPKAGEVAVASAVYQGKPQPTERQAANLDGPDGKPLATDGDEPF